MLDGWTVVIAAMSLTPAYVLLRRRSAIAVDRIRLEVAFGLYAVLLVAVVFFPFRVDPGLRADDAVWDRAAFLDRSVNLVPLASLGRTLSHPKRLGAVAQIGGNLLLLAPLGVFLPLLSLSMRRWWKVVGLALACATAIEVTQLWLFWVRLSIRAIDVDDIILNTVGVLLGYVIWIAWHRLFASRLTSASA